MKGSCELWGDFHKEEHFHKMDSKGLGRLFIRVCVLLSLNFSPPLLPRCQTSSILSVAFISKSRLVTTLFLIFVPRNSHCGGY